VSADPDDTSSTGDSYRRRSHHHHDRSAARECGTINGKWHCHCAADFEVPAALVANSVRNFKSKSGTRIISLLVPFASEVRVSGCGDVSRTSEAGH
jgi:hypothetical protein